MAQAFSNDLRRRILQTYERENISQPAVAERFRVSPDYVKKIRAHQLHTGQMERAPQSRHGAVSRVTVAVQQQLRAELRQQPDLTLWELRQRIQQATGVGLSKSLLWLWLQRLGLRLKKSRSTPKNKTPKKGTGGGRRGGNR